MQQYLNPIPALTWHHTKVNHAPEKVVLPAHFHQPSPIQTLPFSTKDTVDMKLTSGLGETFDQFMQEQNCTCISECFAIQADQPYLIRLELDNDLPCCCLNQHFVVESGVSVTLVEVFSGNGRVQLDRTEVELREHASLTLILVHMLNSDCQVFTSVAGACGDHASFTLHRLETGNSVLCAGSRIILNGNDSSLKLRNAYFGDGNQILDFNDLCIQEGCRTSCEMVSSGILDGACEKNLRGTIDFRRGSRLSRGRESEDVLLFSPNVRHRTAPLILCAEEQVDGQHAASIGKIDPNLLYYLNSRGLTANQARRLLAHARLNPVIDSIPFEAIRKNVHNFCEERVTGYE